MSEDLPSRAGIAQPPQVIDQPRPRRRKRSVFRRVLARLLLVPTGLAVRRWRHLSPPQQLVLGFLSYVIFGVAMLSLPWAQAQPVAFIDNLFGVISAMSTTGLVTVPTGDCYSFFGELTHVILFQLGGIGYMTISSFLVIARGGQLSGVRSGILRSGFALPRNFRIDRFVAHVIIFTAIIEIIGTFLLWWQFSLAGEPEPLWSAVFHCVSAFATAGFGLHANSLENYAGNEPVNVVIGVLSYLGAIGFIVAQDVYYTLRYREHMITFTSKVILSMTAAIFLIGTPFLCFVEPSIREMPWDDRLLAATFQVMTASSTAGFNTIPISPLTNATLAVIVLLMLVGASPSGTGGGIKTTSVSAIFATVLSIARGRQRITLMGNEIPVTRLLAAVAATGLYLVLLSVGVVALCISEQGTFMEIVFEAASGLGTVGLSMGLTASLTVFGKWVVMGLMFAGRVGPLTIGLALFHQPVETDAAGVDDLAV